MSRLESDFQSDFKEKLEEYYPDAIIFKTDPNTIQGFPDLLMLTDKGFAAFECKRSERAARRPNQEYYVALLDSWSFARFVYPENVEEVLDELQRTL